MVRGSHRGDNENGGVGELTFSCRGECIIDAALFLRAVGLRERGIKLVPGEAAVPPELAKLMSDEDTTGTPDYHPAPDSDPVAVAEAMFATKGGHIEFCLGVPDCALEFRSRFSRNELLRLLRRFIRDGHAMEQSLRAGPLTENSLERDRRVD